MSCKGNKPTTRSCKNCGGCKQRQLLLRKLSLMLQEQRACRKNEQEG